MQKKIIASLLVSPVALNALADINIDNVTGAETVGNGNWSYTSIDGTGTIIDINGHISVAVGIGTISQSYTTKAPGTYRIHFTNITNARVTVKAGETVLGQNIADGVDLTYVDFVVAEANTVVTLEVTYIDNTTPYSFDSAEVSIVSINFDDLKTDLNGALDAIDADNITLDPENTSEAAEALRAQIEELKAAIEEIRATITALPAESDTDDVKYEAYTDETNKLYADPNGIEEQIAALGADDLKAAVAAENTRYANHQANQATLDGINPSVDDLRAALKAVTDQLDKVDEDGNVTEFGNVTEYVKGKTADKRAAIEAAIADYEAAIAGVTDEQLDGDPATFEVPTPGDDATLDAIAALQGLYDEAVANEAAFKALSEARIALNNDYNSAYDAIEAIVPVDGYEGSFDSLKAGWKKAITDERTNIYNTIDATTIDDAAANADDNNTAIAAAKAAIQQVVADAQQKASDENTAMTSALADVAALQQSFDTEKQDVAKYLEYGIVDQAFVDAYTAAAQAIQDDINALKTGYESHYADGVNDLADNYPADTATTDAITAAIAALNDDIESNGYDQLYGARSAADNALQALIDQLAEADKGEEGVSYSTLFATNVAELTEAVKNVTDTNVNNVTDAIDVASAAVTSMQEAFQNVDAAYDDFKSTLDILVKIYGEKDIIKGYAASFDSAALDATIANLKNNADTWATDIANAKDPNAAVTNQERYNNVTGIYDTLNNSNWQGTILAAFNDLEAQATTANHAVVDAEYNRIVSGTPAPDATSEALVEIRTAIDEIGTGLAAATAAIGDFADADARQAAVDACAALDQAARDVLAKLQPYSNAQTNYAAVLTNIDAVVTAIQALVDEANANANDPAKTYFLGLAGDATDAASAAEGASLHAQNNQLKADLDAAFADLTINDEATQTKIKSAADAIAAAANSAKASVLPNESAYTADLTDSQETRNFVQNLIDSLADKDQGLIADQLARLETLRDQEDYENGDVILRAIAGVDRDVYKAYSEGACHLGSFSEAYKAIRDEAQKIVNELNDEYANMVVAANEEFIKSHLFDTDSDSTGDTAWAAIQLQLRTDYLAAINTYNEYRKIDNVVYLAYLNSLDPNPITSNAALYNYDARYRTLVNTYNQYIADCNANSVVITEDDFKTAVLDEALAMIDGMATDVATMIAQFDAAAAGFYAGDANGYQGYLAETNAAIAAAEADITAAGFDNTTVDPEDGLTAVGRLLKKATDARDAALDLRAALDAADYAGPVIGLAMDDIADKLLEANNNLDTQTIAEQDWAAAYTAATETLNGYLDDITVDEDDAASVVAAKEAAIEAVKTAVEAALQQAAALNDDVTLDKESATYININNLLGNKTALEAIVAAATTELTNQQAAVQAAEDKAEAVKVFSDAQNDLAAQLEALKAYILTMGGTSDTNTATAEAAVGTVNSLIANTTDIVTDKPTIEAAIATAEGEITTAYGLAMYNEIQYLVDELLEQAQVSYNNAMAATTEADEVKAYAEAIDALLDNAAGINATLSLLTDPAEFQAKALEYEAQICKMIAELQGYYETLPGETTVDGVIAELDAKAQELQDAIDAVNSTIDEKKTDLGEFTTNLDEVAAEVAAIQSELEAIQASYTSTENGAVIALLDSYTRQIEAQAAALAALDVDAAYAADAAAKAEAERIAKSDAQYNDVLLPQYNAIYAEFEAFKQLLEAYGRTEGLASVTAGFENDLAIMKANLDYAYENKTLDENSTLTNASYILYCIRDWSLYVKWEHAHDLYSNLLNVEVPAANQLLNKTLVPSVYTEIYDYLNALTATDGGVLSTLNNNINSFSSSSYLADDETYALGNEIIDGYIAEAEGISARLAELAELAEENTYLPGDINKNGQVNVADVQKLLRMISEGVLLEEIEDPVVACAADINGDSYLDVADVTAVISNIMNEDNSTSYAMVRSKKSSDSTLDAELVSEEGGIRTYALNLRNAEGFVSGQFDLSVAYGSEIVDVTAGERLSAHDMEVSNNFDGTRVVFASMENAKIAGNEGTTVYVKVKGHSSVGIANAIFADETAQAYELGGKTPGTSGIDSVIDGARVMKEAIYDAAGRALKSVQRGINIIRHSDGTVTKELRK